MPQNQEPPKIEFPCPDYPVKVMGAATEEYYSFAVEVMEKHAGGFEYSRLTSKVSRNGNFQSITFYIVATGVEQLNDLHVELKSHPDTKMVL